MKKIKLLCFFVVNFCYAAEQHVSQLFDAIAWGKLEKVTKLLNNNVININIVTRRVLYGMETTPLITASKARLLASKSKHYQVAKLLLDKGADVNKTVETDWTALMFAAQYGNDQIVQLLLDRGAKVDQCDSYRQTALILASDTENQEVIRTLLHYGADVNKKCTRGVSSLARAAGRGCVQNVELLLDNKTSLTFDNISRAIQEAYRYEYYKIVEILEVYRDEYLPYKENKIKEISAIRKELPEIIKSFPNVLFSTLNEYIDDHDYLKFSEFLKYKNKADKKRKPTEFDSNQGNHKKTKN